MRSEIGGLLRALALLVLVALVAMSCAAEQNMREIDQKWPRDDETVEITPGPPRLQLLAHKPPAVAAAVLEPTPEPEPEPEWISLGNFKLTAYCSCYTCCGYWATIRPLDEAGNPIVYTASGAVAEAGSTIAVDPDIIPYGTKVKINDHIYIAQDTGAAITGSRIDVYHDDHTEARIFGIQEAEVFILKEE